MLQEKQEVNFSDKVNSYLSIILMQFNHYTFIFLYLLFSNFSLFFVQYLYILKFLIVTENKAIIAQ